MANLTDEEKEFEELALLEEFEAQDTPSESEGPSTLDKIGDSVGGLAAIPVAIAESVPGAKQIGSAINATIDTFTSDNDAETFSESYQRNLDSVNETVDEYRGREPELFHGTDFAVQMGASAVLGPAALGQKAVLAGNAALGGMNALSRSREQGVEKAKAALGGTVLGGAFTALGMFGPKIVQKGVQKLGKRLKRSAERTVLSTVSPNEGSAFLKKTHNLVEMRYKGDLSKAAKHADEIINLETVLSPKGVAENASNAKSMIGREISDLIDEVDEAALILKGGAKLKDGGVLGAELKHAVGGKSRFAKNLPPVLRASFDEIDQFIDDIVLTRPKSTYKTIYNKVEKMDPLTGGKIIDYVPEMAPEGEIVARQFSAKELFNVKVNIANKVEDVFESSLKGGTMTPAKYAGMKSQQAAIVGKLADVLDSQVAAKVGGGADEAVNALRDLNKKYAMASHLEEVAQHTLSTQSNSAFQIGKNLTSFKGVMLAGAAGISGGPVVAGALLIGQAVAKAPGTPIKVARQFMKLSKFMQNFPEHKIAHEALVAINNTSNPEELQKMLGGVIANISLMENAQAGNPIRRTSDSAKQNQNNIGALIRTKLGDEAAKSFNDTIESDDPAGIGAFMDGLSKSPDAKGLIEQGIGWDGKVYDPADKASLEQEIRRADLPASQEIILLEELNQQNTIPNIQPVEPFQRKFTPRNKDTHGY